MMTPQQAMLLFVYADWVMLFAGLAAIVASLGWCVYAILPSNKGRSRRMLRNALISFLVFTLFFGTQSTLHLYYGPSTLLSKVLFALPVVVMISGFLASAGYAAHAILRRSGIARCQAMLKALLGIVVFVVGAAPHSVALLTPFISAEDHSHHEGTLKVEGESAPDFELAALDGTPFHTADLHGRVIVLNFFATWCGPCQMELPHLQSIWDEFRDNDEFRMLAVGREESNASLNAFRREHGFTLPMASDPDKSTYAKFASGSIPRTYLISRQGTIVYQWTGGYETEISKLRRLLARELAKKR
jgi:peroxiredoxin